jgi:lipopolysaccharide transport system ATP-binding protein
MSTVIKVENISKQYRLGDVGTGALAHDVNKWWHKVRGKENPYLKIGEINDRSVKGESDYVWALKDINFEVKQGEVLGIIGRNGAGKSTLLKILSKTTTPTTGSIKIKGRIASLLEVGTGFHPELSGRENIFLNGAILGMTKREIKSKFDEIVDFAGVERYIDTPVKRYSSGMYVRLAFGVAAHLEPEILIVDEVLAVGDAEFQKKALGKMKEVSEKGGRTVLFVSHNIPSLMDLCKTGLLLENGIIKSNTNIQDIVTEYLKNDNSSNFYTSTKKISSIFISKIWSVDYKNENSNKFRSVDNIIITVQLLNALNKPKNCTITVIVSDQFSKPIFSNHLLLDKIDKNNSEIVYIIKSNFLLSGVYNYKVLLHVPFVEFVENDISPIEFEIYDSEHNEHSKYSKSNVGIINAESSWQIK